MDEDRDRRIERLLQRRVAKVRIAEELGIARDTVDRVAAGLGFPSRRRGNDPYDWPAIRAFYEAGNSAAATMRRFGFRASTWEAAIARGDVTPRPRAYTERPRGKTRALVERLLNEGIGIAEIAERLGVSKPTVCYHARRLGVPPQSRFGHRYDWAEIRREYDSGVAMRECMRRFGFSQQAWADAVKRGEIVQRERVIPLDDLLVVGRKTSRAHLKRRLVEAGLKENRCEICGITKWLGKPLNMQLHHKSGDGLDNRIENLEFLCANCHSQTDTYGGRNGHRKPDRHLRLVGSKDREEAA
jgi:DNA-binding transcriptional ArsR family regulator